MSNPVDYDLLREVIDAAIETQQRVETQHQIDTQQLQALGHPATMGSMVSTVPSTRPPHLRPIPPGMIWDPYPIIPDISSYIEPISPPRPDVSVDLIEDELDQETPHVTTRFRSRRNTLAISMPRYMQRIVHFTHCRVCKRNTTTAVDLPYLSKSDRMYIRKTKTVTMGQLHVIDEDNWEDCHYCRVEIPLSIANSGNRGNRNGSSSDADANPKKRKLSTSGNDKEAAGRSAATKIKTIPKGDDDSKKGGNSAGAGDPTQLGSDVSASQTTSQTSNDHVIF